MTGTPPAQLHRLPELVIALIDRVILSVAALVIFSVMVAGIWQRRSARRV